MRALIEKEKQLMNSKNKGRVNLSMNSQQAGTISRSHTTKIISGYKYINDISSKSAEPNEVCIKGRGAVTIQVSRKWDNRVELYCRIIVDGNDVLPFTHTDNFRLIARTDDVIVYELCDIKFNESIKIGFYRNYAAKQNNDYVKIIAMLEE